MTDSNIKSIIEGLSNVSDNYFLFENEKKQIVNNYRGKMLETEIAEAESRTRSAVSSIVNRMLREIDSLIKETEEGNNYDDDASIATAAQLLSKNGISFNAVEAVIKRFAGNQVALELLEAAAAEEIKPLFTSWRFDNVGKLQSIRHSINALTWESISNYPSLVSAAREGLQEFCRRQGIELGEMTEAIERMRMRNITMMMGLDPDNI